jgi:hypothetical protein
VSGHAISQVVLGGALLLVGLAVLATTLAAGGGPLALGVLVGVAFAVLGGMRIWIARRGAGPGGER